MTNTTNTTNTTKTAAKTAAGNKLARLLASHLLEASAEKVHTALANGVTFDDLERLAVEYLKDYEGNPWNMVDESDALIVLDYYEDGRWSVITTRGELGQIYGQNLRTVCK